MVAGLTDLTSTTMTVAYFSQEGYYAKNDPRQRRASFWHGAAAAALGLPKHVSPRRFERILSGYVPGTDIRLGRVRDGEHQHRPGFDLTLSAPKTVSLEALLYGDRRVLGAHDAAVKATLDWLERDLLQTRSWDPVTRQRPRVAANGLVAAGFRHLTSRDQDPQLHTHCIVANMTRNRAGAWRSVEPTEIRRNVRLIGAVYRQELAQRLLGLGFAIEATMIGGVPGFEIAGYGRGFVDAFSSRRREILAWLDKHGLPWSAALTQQAALITRKKKTDKDVDELRAEWQARAERLGLSRDRSIAKPGLRRTTTVSRKTARKAGRPYVRTAEELRPDPPGLSAREVTWRAVEHLAERASVIREREIRAIALGHAPGRHGLADIDAAVAGLMADGHLVEAEVRGGRSFVTREALGLERGIMAHKRQALGASQPLAEETAVSSRLAETTLTEGQRQAVRTILLSHDGIVAVQGAAGTGKTAMLNEALGLLGARGAVLLAPSAAAARVLSEETGVRARTLQWFLTRHGDLGDGARVARDRQDHEGSVLVLDEASMVSTAEMELLMRIAARFRVARLVLVGDRRQLRAVSAGEPFRALQEAGVATAEMDEVLRQRDPALKAAVEHLKEGRPREALRGLEHVHEAPQEELGAETARLWLALDPEERARTAILAPTHFIRAEIHRVVRDGLAREGVLHGRELELDRYANRHLTAAQRSDVLNHEPGDIVLFHSRVAPLRVEKGDACRVMRTEGEFVFLEHPTGRTVRIRPGDKWVRYRFGLYETARIRIRAGDRIRWTMNDERRGLVNGGDAVVREIGSRRVKFDLRDGKTLSLARTDPQLHHIDHAWSTTVHAAQGMTRDAAIGVLDTGHGALTGQAGLYVEASRARDRFVLVTDNRERLEEVLEANDGSRMTALEAVGEGEDPPPGAPGATLAMLRDLEADWRALVARAETQGSDLARTDGYARIVTGAAMLAEDMELPADLRAFVEEVRVRDAQAIAERRQGFAFLRRAERHCRDWPLLKWAAAKRGRPLGDLPEHAAWLAEGKTLADRGQKLREGGGRAIAASIAGVLRRLVSSRELDEAERFREAAARHETGAQTAGVAPREAAGALAEWARRLRGRDLPEGVRPAVEAWCAADAERGPAAETPPTLEDSKAALEIETFLLDCGGLLFDPRPGSAAEPDLWDERAEMLREQGLRMLGDGPGAKLDDPLRIRLARVGAEREQVREAVDRLAEAALQRRSERLVRMTGRQRRESGSDPVDLPSRAVLRDRAEELRGEARDAGPYRDAAAADDIGAARESGSGRRARLYRSLEAARAAADVASERLAPAGALFDRDIDTASIERHGDAAREAATAFGALAGRARAVGEAALARDAAARAAALDLESQRWAHRRAGRRILAALRAEQEMAPPLTAADVRAWRALRERQAAARDEAGALAATVADALEAEAPGRAARWRDQAGQYRGQAVTTRGTLRALDDLEAQIRMAAPQDATAWRAAAEAAEALMAGAGHALREEAEAAAGRAGAQREAEAARGCRRIRDAVDEADAAAGESALIYQPGIEPLGAEAARLLATPGLSDRDRRYLEQFQAVIDSEIRVRDTIRNAIRRARAHLETYPAILDRALAPEPPAPEEEAARPGLLGRALGLFRAEDDIPPAPEPAPRALNDVDPDYRKWDIRAEQFVETFRNWRASGNPTHSDHVDRRWIDMADLVAEIEAIRRAARDPEAGPRRIELPDAGAFAAADQRHDPGRLDMLMHAVTRPEDERNRDALVELARRNRAWPEETLAAFRRHVREAVDPDDRLSLSGLAQDLPAELARSFENLSAECWRHMGEIYARRQELTRGYGLSY